MTRFMAFARLLWFSVAAVSHIFAAMQSAFAQEKPVTNEEIPALVDDLVAPSPDYSSARRLEAIGKRATPELVRLLNDPKRCGVVDNRNGYKSARLKQVAHVLRFEHAPEVVEPLTRYLKSDEVTVRAAAALGLGVVASKECVTPVLEALADPNDRIADEAMLGIHWARKKKSYSEEFMQKVFPGLEKIARNRKREWNPYAYELLAAIDATRAVKFVESPDVLTVDNPHVFHAINALNEVGAKIDREKLLRFLQISRPIAGKNEDGFAYCAALHAYGVNPDANTEAILRGELKSEIDVVAMGAADGLAAMAGVINPRDFVFRRVDKVGQAGLTPRQRHFLLAPSVNGSLRGFFENESGDSWKEMLEALDAIGATEQAKVLRRAISLFEPQKPDVDDVKRRDQLDKFSPERQKTLDKLSEEYEKCRPNIGVLTMLYAAAHAKEFRE